MIHSQKHIIIVAGEASGDLHAANLVNEIKLLNPQIRFSGLGGQKMKAAGVELYEDLTGLAVVGFFEVLRHLGKFREVFRRILSEVSRIRPDAVILVDYPGFNLRLAQELKKLNIKVIYYISPQVWAWKENRVRLIKQFTDKMLVLFEFEKRLYARHGLDVELVGHPLLDSVRAEIPREEFLRGIGFSPQKTTLALLPGSREKEVAALLPIMIAAAKILYDEDPQRQFLVLRAPTVDRNIFERETSHAGVIFKIIDDKTYEGINAADACFVASGTATLETAILQKPMVVIYKTSLLTWALAKLFVKIPDIGLVNVVAGGRIVPECIQFEATAEKIAEEMRAILGSDVSSEPKMAQIKLELAKVKSSLGAPGASRRAAESVLRSISEPQAQR